MGALEESAADVVQRSENGIVVFLGVRKHVEYSIS